MDQETAKRRELAGRVAGAFQESLNACASIVVGSTARAKTDRYSDIDMTVFFRELPDQQAAADIQESLGITDRRKLGEGDERAFMDTFFIDGIDCQIGFSTVDYLEEFIDDVLLRNDTDHDKHTIMGGLMEALPLYGDELVEGWKTRLANYPPELARAMVTAHLDFRPVWMLRERFAGRDTLIVFQTIAGDIARKLLGVYLGLNRLYPEHDFKRLSGLIDRMSIAPENFDQRLRTLVSGRYDEALHEIQTLVEETFALVEQHMPDIDTSAARSKFSRPDPTIDG